MGPLMTCPASSIRFLGHYVSRGAQMDWRIACLASVGDTDRSSTFALAAEVGPTAEHEGGAQTERGYAHRRREKQVGNWLFVNAVVTTAAQLGLSVKAMGFRDEK